MFRSPTAIGASTKFRSPTAVAVSSRVDFMCGFEIDPMSRPWALKFDQLTQIQSTLRGKHLVIKRMAAFSRHPGAVTVWRGEKPYEAMTYSLQLLSMKWPDPFITSICEIEADQLQLSVTYDNGVKAAVDERVLIVLAGQMFQPRSEGNNP